MKLYHYAVFLRTRAGTVRRNVAITERSVSKAGRQGQQAVERHVKEMVVLIDVVPMRERKAKSAPTVLRPRSRAPVTVTKAKWVMTRKPKARESAILTKKGVRAYISQTGDVHDPHIAASEKVSAKNAKRPAPFCQAKACVERGRCGHKRPPGVEIICFEATVKVGTGAMLLRVFAVDEATARRLMRASLKEKGYASKRLSGLARNYNPDPLRTIRGELIV